MADREEELRELWSIFDGDIKDSTALDPQTLEDIFIQYGGRGTPFRKRSDVVHFFVFLKSYPTARSWPTVVNGQYRHKFRKIMIQLEHLFTVMDEFTRLVDERNLDSNKMPEILSNVFDVDNVRLCVDTFPVYLRRPKKNQRWWYQAKYHAHVAKIQAVTDLKGNILWISGPHLGSTGDITLWRWYRPSWLRAEEIILGDKAYIGGSNCVCPKKKPAGGELTTLEKSYNLVHCHFRVRCEHAFGAIKRWGIVSQRYRGRVTADNGLRLHKIVSVMAQVVNMFNRNHPTEVGKTLNLLLARDVDGIDTYSTDDAEYEGGSD